MDEKRLDEIVKTVKDSRYPLLANDPDNEFDELIRLARLGLWAEKHMEVIEHGLCELDTTRADQALDDGAYFHLQAAKEE